MQIYICYLLSLIVFSHNGSTSFCEVTRSPLHEVDHVNHAWCTNHGLVRQDSLHCLLHTKLWLQRGQEWLNLLTVRNKTGQSLGGRLLVGTCDL